MANYAIRYQLDAVAVRCVPPGPAARINCRRLQRVGLHRPLKGYNFGMTNFGIGAGGVVELNIITNSSLRSLEFCLYAGWLLKQTPTVRIGVVFVRSPDQGVKLFVQAELSL
jgi:hypothetical protein